MSKYSDTKTTEKTASTNSFESKCKQTKLSRREKKLGIKLRKCCRKIGIIERDGKCRIFDGGLIWKGWSLNRVLYENILSITLSLFISLN